MEQNLKFQVHEKYQEIFLPFVTSLAAAHMIICYQQPGNPFKVIFANGYVAELFVNFLFALFVFFAITIISLTLDNFYSWEHKRWSRLWLQFLLGIIGTMVLSIIVSATYLARSDQNISETDFFDVVFWMILGYVFTINMYYHAGAMVNWKHYGHKTLRKLESTPLRHVPAQMEDRPGTKAALLRLLKQHDVMLFYTEKETVYAKLSSGETIQWNFRMITTLEMLDPERYIQVNRYHVVRRDAIADVNYQPLKEQVIILLKAPVNDVLHVGKAFKDPFNGWWSCEGE